MKKALLKVLLFLLPMSLLSQANVSGVVNSYSAVSSIDTCANSITVGNPGFFSPGDTVLLIQMQGAIVDVSNTASFGTVNNYNGSGLYEYNIVQTVNGTNIVFQFELSNPYDPNGSLQLITVPQYNAATLIGAVNAQAWNGSTGGVITFMVNGTLDLAGQTIDADGAGFRGGTYVNIASSCNFLTNATGYFYPVGNWQGAPRGEGISAIIPGLEWGRGAQANAGGGGNDHNAGGGGGSNLAAGGQGGENQDPGTFNCKGFFPGLGGRALAGSNARVFLGGGGGAGHGNNTSNSSGGDGGGIIMIKANSIEGNNGTITARGADGQPSSNDGAGGGGGGGTVFLETGNFSASNLTVIVDGGDGADAANIANRCYGPGGGGGSGAIYLGTPGVPANVTLNRSGGANGISASGTNPCAGSALNAAPGLSGIFQNSANLFFSTNIPSSAITINCPANINLSNTAGQCSAPATYPIPTATGGCGIISITRIQGLASGSLFPLGSTTVTYVASDTFGLSDTCSFLVTVSDTQSPQFAPPVSINQCNTNVTVAPFQVNDNCGVDSVWNSFNGTADASDIYPLGTTTVTWFAQDSSGNLVQASFNVTVSAGVLRDTTTINLCQGDSFNGQAYTSDTLWVDSLIAGNGCDSLHYTQIRVGSVFLNPINPIVCQGDSFVVGSNVYTASGLYSDTFNNVAGCDSVVQTNLIVVNIPVTQQNPTICQGDSFFAAGSWQTGSGIYFDTFSSANNCDSVVRSFLIVSPAPVTLIDTGVCQGDSIFLAGAWRFFPGQFRDTLTVTGTACDSVVQFNLILYPRLATSGNSDTICEGDSLLIGNIWYDSTGIFIDTTTSVRWGCDSIVSNFLFVRPAIPVQNLNPNICTGDTFRVGGNAYTSTGVYSDTLQTDHGCDSIINTNLTVNTSLSSSRNVAICQGDSIFLEGAWQSSPGIFFDTLISVSGCDSIVESNLTVLATDFNAINLQICQGDSVFAGGTWQFSSGQYFDTLTNTIGCDSIIETNLSVIPNSASSQNPSICLGDSFFAAGAWQTSTGIYFDTLLNSGGCDSVIQTNLTVSNQPNTLVNLSLCQGQSYFAGGANQTSNGTYFDTLTASTGCDSIIETSLVFNPAPQFNEVRTICTGDSAFLGGSWQNQPGVYTDTFSDSQGCDSVINTTLNIINQLTASRNLTICEGDSVFAGGAQQGTSGVFRDTFTSLGGCDSVLTTNLTVQPAAVNRSERGICVGDSAFLEGAWRFLPGTYYDTTISPGGCLQILETRLFVSPPVVIVQPNQTTTILAGQSIRLEATGSNAYQWTPGNSLSCDDCEDPLASPAVTTTYFVSTTDPNGCPSTDSITIIVDTVGSVTIPNVFTPNGDGINDEWYINVQGVEGVEIQIFDRWGQKVFESQDPNARWDGTFNGTLLDAAVFAYYVKLIYPGFQEDLTGDITLIR